MLVTKMRLITRILMLITKILTIRILLISIKILLRGINSVVTMLKADVMCGITFLS